MAGLLLNTNGWIFETGHAVESSDLRDHIDYLVRLVSPRQDALQTLRESGWAFDLLAEWEDAAGGGPTLSPPQMSRLAELDLDIWIAFFEAAVP